jgi:hypothetical protein
MHKLTPMAVLMTLVAAAAFLAKVKYGFYVGN